MNPEYDELLVLAETLGEVKSKTEKLEAEFSTQARPLEAATNALSAALSGIKALQFHVLDNNLGQLSARVEEMRKAVDEQVGVIALELKKADETNAAKAGQEAEALRSQIAALQAQLGTLGAQFSAQLERVEFSAKEEAKKLQLIPGPAGAAGASLNPRGTFIDGETYNRLDVVSWLGSSYIAAVDGVTEKPSRNSNQWQVLASRGGGAAGGAADFGSLAGVAQINQGGTGQTTRAAALNALLPDQAGATQYMLLTDGAGNVSWGAQPVAGLPSQTGNSGKLLTTNGTSASWSNAVTVSGSNATVTGTLTVNGGATVGGGSFAAASFYKSSSLGSVLSGATGSSYDLYITNPAGNYILQVPTGTRNAEFAGTLTTVGNVTVGAALTVQATTASTTTSSGALVVSGGVGVAGNINAGGYLRSINSSAANGSEFTALRADVGADATLGAALVTIGVLPSATAASRYGFITCYDNGDWRTLYLGGSPGVAANGGQVRVPANISSTSTSSGALVVSGGVGVAGAINAGGAITSNNGSGSGLLGMRSSSGNASYVFWSETSVADRGILGFNNGSSTLSYRSGASSFSTGTEVFSVGSDGTITSTTSTNSGVLQLNLVNSSTGTSASSLFRFNAGTRTASLQAYNDTHATLAGQLRVSTSNGDIVVIPSGVTATTFGSSTVTVNHSTASTSTSSGALVVSGGVGVAKRIHSGEGLTTGGDNETHISFVRNGTVSIGPDSTGTPALVVSSAIKTSAPSGGTAANWKLGTVATVSPTSPNRTIEVDIGGTIYYIHAKTTNN